MRITSLLEHCNNKNGVSKEAFPDGSATGPRVESPFTSLYRSGSVLSGYQISMKRVGIRMIPSVLTRNCDISFGLPFIFTHDPSRKGIGVVPKAISR